jgi:hypothetical protein
MGSSWGQEITIGERAADVYTIIKISPPAIDIESNDDLPGAQDAVPVEKAIAFSPAGFSTFGEVVNIGNSTAHADDTLLKLADRYVTVTATVSMTLPKSPVDGQTPEIKSRPRVTMMVETEDPDPPMPKLKIDGEESVTLAPGDNRTFRYSAVIGGSGLLLCAKRLARDRFDWPEEIEGVATVAISATEFAALIDGLELTRTRATLWWRKKVEEFDMT